MSGKVEISFTCPECKNLVKKLLTICEPEWGEDKAIDRVVDSSDFICCDNCNAEFDFSIQNDPYEVYVKCLNTHLEDLCVGEPKYFFDDDYFDWIASSQTNCFFDSFVRSIDEYKQLVNEKWVENNQTILRMIVVSTVSAMETYLADVLIDKIDKNEKFLLNAAKHVEDLKNERLTIASFIENSQIAKKKVLEKIRSFIFHQLPKIKNVFRSVLKIEFVDDISQLMIIVNRRHDIVHRNGKNQKGEILDLSQQQVLDDISKIESFIKDINKQVDSI